MRGKHRMEHYLLRARVNYIMENPTNFLNVEFSYAPQYDPRGWGQSELPETIDTKGKIFVVVWDTRGIFSNKSGIALLDQFKKSLETIYSFIQVVARDMNTDIVAKFLSEEGDPLGYFYRGKYHLWGQ